MHLRAPNPHHEREKGEDMKNFWTILAALPVVTLVGATTAAWAIIGATHVGIIS